MWEKRLIDGILSHRALVLAVTLAITAVAGVYATRVAIDSDIEIWFLEDDESLVTYREFLKQFDSDEIEVIGIFADDVFTPELLGAVDRITTDTRDAPHVLDVVSLTNAKIVALVGPLHVSTGPLMEEVPATAEEARDLKKRALTNIMIRDNLVSGDGRATAIIVEMDPKGNTVEGKKELISALKKIVASHIPGNVEWHLAGSPSLDDAFFSYTERDFEVLAPVSVAVVLIVCLILLRRALVSLAPLSVVVLATIWTFGLMGALGIKINVISSSLVALILAVGVADSIHVISDYYQHVKTGTPRKQTIANSTAGLVLPCFFTSATTAAGFLSLLTSDLKPVAEFGWLAATGISIAFVLSLTFLPVVLSLMPAPKPRTVNSDSTGFIDRLLGLLGSPTKRSSRMVLAASGALLLVAG